MIQTPLLIFASGATWQVAVDTSQGPAVRPLQTTLDAAPDQVAGQVAAVLEELNVKSTKVVVGLPSTWCLCASVLVGDLPRQQRRQAMLYRLEESLPIEAEALAADFAPAPRQQRNKALGVATERQRLLPLIQALEDKGLAVDAACPLALLAVQAKARDLQGQQVDLVLWGHGDQVEMLTVQEGLPTAWEVLPCDLDDLVRRLDIHQANASRSLRLALYDLDPAITAALKDQWDQSVVETAEDAMPVAALETAGEAVRGKTMPWIELRRHAIASSDPLRHVRKAVNVAVAACILLALTLSVSMLWRARQYQDLERVHQDQQAAVFRQTFPSQRVPASVRMRLAAEERRLEGLSGAGTSGGSGGTSGGGDASGGVPNQVSALETLYQLLRRLPTDLRYRILEMRLEGERLLVEGESRSHADADRIAAALRAQQGFDLESPKTQQLQDQGVAFTLTGVLPQAPRQEQQPQTARDGQDQQDPPAKPLAAAGSAQEEHP